jgi:heme exporter protein D
MFGISSVWLIVGLLCSREQRSPCLRRCAGRRERSARKRRAAAHSSE